MPGVLLQDAGLAHLQGAPQNHFFGVLRHLVLALDLLACQQINKQSAPGGFTSLTEPYTALLRIKWVCITNQAAEQYIHC